MTGVTIASEYSNRFQKYREAFKMTIPTIDNSSLAQKFEIAFVPAIVIVAPNDNRAYVKSGEQRFVGMYEFVKAVQGREAEITPEVQRLISATNADEKNFETEGLLSKQVKTVENKASFSNGLNIFVIVLLAFFVVGGLVLVLFKNKKHR